MNKQQRSRTKNNNKNDVMTKKKKRKKREHTSTYIKMGCVRNVYTWHTHTPTRLLTYRLHTKRPKHLAIPSKHQSNVYDAGSLIWLVNDRWKRKRQYRTDNIITERIYIKVSLIHYGIYDTMSNYSSQKFEREAQQLNATESSKMSSSRKNRYRCRV